MLDAHDKVAVVAWSERQLGDAAKRAAIVEIGGDLAQGRVEKSGTGIEQFSCEPFLSVMADSIQHLSEARTEQAHYLDFMQDVNFKSHRSVIH